MNPGIYSRLELPASEYHAAPGASNSGLSIIYSKTPAHYIASKQFPRKETPALIEGRRLHSFILEPDVFDATFAVSEKFDMRTNVGKQGHADWLKANGGKTPITADDLNRYQSIREAIIAHPEARNLLSAPCVTEQSVFTNDPETGILVKARQDIYNDGIIADLKSTTDANPNEFFREAFNYGYHRQAAFYLDVMTWATGRTHDTFRFIVFEKEPPFAVVVLEASEKFLQRGREEYRRALNTYAECLRSGHWPPYSLDVMPMVLPPWAEKRGNLDDIEDVEDISYVQ